MTVVMIQHKANLSFIRGDRTGDGRRVSVRSQRGRTAFWRPSGGAGNAEIDTLVVRRSSGRSFGYTATSTVYSAGRSANVNVSSAGTGEPPTDGQLPSHVLFTSSVPPASRTTTFTP